MVYLRPRTAALLAINLLFLMVWGFTGLGKLFEGPPPWFPEKFGKTFMATFPGLTASFWLLAAAEILAFVLALIALIRLEFLERRPLHWLSWSASWSLFVFVMLSFGQWLTKDYNATFQLFVYFGATLVALQFCLNPYSMVCKFS